MNIRKKLSLIFTRKDKSVRKISGEINIPKSTVYYNLQQMKNRQLQAGTDFWDTDFGYDFLIRLIISTIYSFAVEIELILGVDETWFDKMLLVCQELQSGFIFCEESAEDRSAATWDKHIKKTFALSE